MGYYLFAAVNACLDKLGPKWDKQAGIPTDGCPNMTEKFQMQDKVTEMK